MGGNVFESASPIHRSDIDDTLFLYCIELKSLFPKRFIMCDMFHLVGSAHKKEYSNDIDVAIDEALLEDPSVWSIDVHLYEKMYKKFKKAARTATDNEIQQRSLLYCIGNTINESSKLITCDLKKIRPGNMFTLMKQAHNGQIQNTFVQIDWLVGNIPWLMFSYYSKAYSDDIKGLHRTQLLLAMFTAIGMTFKHINGVYDKKSGKIVANTPEEALEILKKHYSEKISLDDLYDYYKLCDVVNKQSKKIRNTILSIYFSVLDKTRCDIPTNLQKDWMKRRDDLKLTGKFLPMSSNLRNVL